MNEEEQLLLTDDGELTEELTNFLTKTFERFDKDSDNMWNLSELQDFSRITNNGKELSKEEVDEILEFFGDAIGQRITLNGFLDFYHTQTSGNAEETLRDLKALGFDSFNARDESS